MASSMPRALDALEFAAARATELRALEIAASEGSDLHPWSASHAAPHKRRRPSSHQPFERRRRRNAKRMRMNEEGAAASFSGSRAVPLGRRAQRRASRLQGRIEQALEYRGTSENAMRIATHRWHKKRFVFKRRFGMCLPMAQGGRGRGARALCSSTAAIHDAAYMLPVELSGDSRSIGLALKSLCGCGGDKQRLREYRRWLYDTDGKAVGPFCFQWSSDCDTVLGWIHPACFEEVSTLMRHACAQYGISYNFRGSLGRIEVVGSGAHKAIERSLTVSSLEGFLPPGKGETQTLECIHPALTESEFASVSEGSSLSSNKGIAVQRMRYYPPPPSQEEIGSLHRSHRLPLERQHSEVQSMPCSNAHAGSSMFHVPIAFIRRPAWRRCGFHGFSVVLPVRWLPKVFQSLVYHGCRPVGLTQWEWLGICSGAPCFPKDFLETKAGQKLWREMASEEIERQAKRPPRVRKESLSPSTLGATFTSLTEGGSDSNRAMSAKGLAEALWGKGRYHPTVDNAMTLTWERSASFEGDCLLRVRILHSWGGNFQAGAALCWADASESFPAKTSKVSSDEMKQAVGKWFGRRRLGTVTSAVPPGLSPSTNYATGVCSAQALWQARVEQLSTGDHVGGSCTILVVEGEGGPWECRRRPVPVKAFSVIECDKYDLATW